MFRNFNEGHFGQKSGNYKQAPFEDIGKELFENLESSLKKLDLSCVFEHEDAIDLQAETACAGGACAIP